MMEASSDEEDGFDEPQKPPPRAARSWQSQTDWLFENLDDTTAGDAAVTKQGEGNESDDDTGGVGDMVDEGIEDI
jgi:hypothetical protein